jgi:membrane AbrB-like protein
MPLHLFSRVRTLILALLGAGLFHFLGLPLPFLFGPMTFCLLVALAGLQLKGMGTISTAARTILGAAIGASVTPEIVGRVPQLLGSVALVPVYVALIGIVGVPFFRRLGYDPATAWYAAMPGGLQDMVAFGKEAGGDARALALIHATRMLIILTVAPIILTLLYGASLTGALGEPARNLPPVELALMAAAAVIGWKGGEKLGLFGASILGPMILTAALSLGGFIHSRPPVEAIVVAQVFIGLGIGVQYVGVTLREVRSFILSGIAFVAILALLAALFTEIVILSGLAKPVEGFLAFAPGGQAEVTVLALAAGADLGFVILHHLTRMMMVIMGAPVAARWVGIRKPND